MAANCHKPNPRKVNSKTPETNSVQVLSDPEPEVSATFGTVLVPVQENGHYTPFVYPNGSSNPMLKNYSWAELNKAVTPYGS